MEFEGFEQNDFDTFKIDGLEDRMAAIREHIQPKFKAIGDEIVDDLAAQLGNEMFVHIAQHARRTVNPPNDTWMAFSSSNRGYKMLPHFRSEERRVGKECTVRWAAYFIKKKI